MDEMSNTIVSNKEREDEQDDGEESQLPGFRFYPTDEELVTFYLMRKVESRPFSIDLIRETDIYKYDPWDLSKTSTVGDNEWYFFCRRGRKYRNSVRPNRVTGSGFWKATGIDKPIYATNNSRIVGLKKSLVYYTGSAGKGTKTDWMMHEFRLPAPLDFITHNSPPNVIAASSNDTQDSEVWTVCRIFNRNVPSRKYTSNWREISTKRSRSSSPPVAYNNRVAYDNNNDGNKNKCIIKGENYISFNNIGTSSSQQILHLTDQNPDISASTVSQYDRTSMLTTTQTDFAGHEQCSTSNYNNLGSGSSTIMAAMTPFPNPQPHHNASVVPDPMDIASPQENTTDQFVTKESWDELRKLWSFFQE